MPGPQGPAGANGTNGTDGDNAWSLSTTGTDVMPAEGDSVTITVSPTSDWMAVGQVLYVQFWGWMQVTDKPTAVTVTLLNLEDTGTGTYADNSAPGTVLPAGATISPGGLQGPTGTTDTSLFLQVANNLNDVADVAASRLNLGLGSAAQKDAAAGDGDVPFIDDVAGLNSGEAVFVAASGGLEGLTPTQARSTLGLVIGTADTEIPPVDDAAGLTAGEIVVATADGLETQDATSIKALLGVTGNAMLLFQDIRANTVNSTAGTGAVQTVPLNTESVDTGNNGSISGSSEITLTAGTYRYRYGIVGYDVGITVGWLYDVTAVAVISASYATPIYGAVMTTVAFGQGRFTIAAPHVIRLEAVLSGGATPLFGKAASLGFPEQYSWLELFKE